LRSIVKGAECKELKDWKKLNATSPQNIHYDNLGKAQRSPMLEALVKEQGAICAYTMKPIARINGSWQAHIEHILPRSKYPADSVDWKNIVACVPDPDSSCEYGAKLKDKYDAGALPFTNPTMSGVSAQFRFRENGEVEGLTEAATESLNEKVLYLNHSNLVHDRVSKIRGALDQKPSAARARQRAQELRKFDKLGTLEPYCEAVAQVLDAYASRLEKRAQRVSGAKRKGK
jgi:uncharacterized protein (TIGR02646 family)